VLTWVVFGAQIAWFGFGNAQVAMRDDSRITDFSYWAFSVLLIVLWMGALSWSDSRSYRVIGIGTSEYVRIAVSSFRLFGVIAIVAFLTRIDVARGFLLLSLPVGVAVLLWTRWLWRQWLLSKRRTGSGRHGCFSSGRSRPWLRSHENCSARRGRGTSSSGRAARQDRRRHRGHERAGDGQCQRGGVGDAGGQRRHRRDHEHR
jgi:hypothetical protein